MDNGFITLHRKIKDHPVWQSSQLFHLFCYLLVNANYEDSRFLTKKYGVIIIKRGQLVTGRHKISREIKIKPSTVYVNLMVLKDLQIIDIKPDNKKSVITILKYDEYQTPKNKLNNHTDTKVTPKEQLDDTKITQSNKDNKENKDIASKTLSPIHQVFDIFYQSINPGINFGNKTSIQAAEWLLSKFGLEETLQMANYAVKVHDRDFAPSITTPYELKIKYPKLVKFRDSTK